MYGGYHMVVIDFWDGSHPPALSDELLGRVSEAIQLLHLNNFVFGDLCLPDILVKGQEAVLVDFDWCSKASEGRYPVEINPDVNWPRGVGPGEIMLKEHDLEMLQNLQDNVQVD